MLANLDKVKGSLLGGAIGDSFGAPVEFSKLADIKKEYGPNGITFANFKGQPRITDDTQMTLFTANGLLLDGNVIDNIWLCYQDWLDTQFKHDKTEMSHEPISWLVDDPRMFASREPGRTCIFEIMRNHKGSLTRRYNQSKGCGGIMRVAPIGLVDFPMEKVIEYGARTAALTHGNLISSVASAYFATLIYYLSHSEMNLRETIDQTTMMVTANLSKQPALNAVMDEVELAKSLVDKSTDSDVANLTSLGQGWVAEETLGVAIYCALKYEDDFKKAIEVSVNHDGDSDSTGNLVGQLLGAEFGTKVLPQHYLAKLELRDVIEKMAGMLVV